MNEAPKPQNTESLFSVLAVVALLILSLLGAWAMLVGSVIGLAAYVFLFRERLRAHGWLTTAVTTALSAALAATVAIAVSLI